MSKLFKSPETTWSAILALVVLIGNTILYQIDGDPSTVPNWGALITELFIIIGLLRARDNNVNSEAAGASCEK